MQLSTLLHVLAIASATQALRFETVHERQQATPTFNAATTIHLEARTPVPSASRCTDLPSTAIVQDNVCAQDPTTGALSCTAEEAGECLGAEVCDCCNDEGTGFPYVAYCA